MEKKLYIQPEIKSLTVGEDLMAASIESVNTNGQNDIDYDSGATDQDGGAKENTWANTPSVWD